ncbi:MAG: sulfite exporter TauE/SafE family protein [Caryophanon sp.]|nr:sulfite exporter TauE/SafE family protein [Caryophanon sp.]
MEIDVSFTYVAVIFAIGFFGSFISGMLGVGGSIIKYPMLLYIPAMFGFTAFTAHEVSGISAVQVLFASLAGVWAYRKSGLLHKALIIYMGSAILVGSLVGSYGSSLLSESAVNIVYGVLAVIAAVMMFMPKKQVDEAATITFNKPLAATLAFIVGIASGIIGAAGGFLLVPILLTVLHIPTRITIATSLAITFISSIGGSVGKIVTGQVEYFPAIIMIIASIIAAPLGVKLGQKMNVNVLQWLLAVMIAATAVKIWMDIL